MVAVIGVVVVLGMGAAFLLMPVEHYRIASDDGRFHAIVTSPRYQSYLPAMPGQSGDKPGDIVIVDNKGRSYGSVPLGMIQYSRDLHWHDNGASIRLVGRWNFDSRCVHYWNESQTAEISRCLTDQSDR